MTDPMKEFDRLLFEMEQSASIKPEQNLFYIAARSKLRAYAKTLIGDSLTLNSEKNWDRAYRLGRAEGFSQGFDEGYDARRKEDGSYYNDLLDDDDDWE